MYSHLDDSGKNTYVLLHHERIMVELESYASHPVATDPFSGSQLSS